MKRQPGVISLITAIMVSILLITMAMGLLILTNGGTQQASDDELSLRAYAAAEGGVEWAEQYALNNPNKTYNNCTAAGGGQSVFSDLTVPSNLYSFLNSGTNSQNAITCILINTSPSLVQGTLNANNANQVVVDPSATPLQDIEVSWLDGSQPSDPAFTSPYSKYGTASINSLPANTTVGLLPGIELTIVTYATSGGNISPGASFGNITTKNVILLPGSSQSVAYNPNFSGPTQVLEKAIIACSNNPSGFDCTNPAAGAGSVLPAWTSGVGGRALNATEGAIIYIRALYPNPSGFHYSICLRNTAGCMQVQKQSAVIDVTARSGPVYRRIVATATPPNPQVPSGLNYVLFGDQNICKDFNIFQTSVTNVAGSCQP